MKRTHRDFLQETKKMCVGSSHQGSPDETPPDGGMTPLETQYFTRNEDAKVQSVTSMIIYGRTRRAAVPVSLKGTAKYFKHRSTGGKAIRLVSE